ncbi:MAG: tetratricopeptide repeat protein [Xanthobacteraceae bacterium]
MSALQAGRLADAERLCRAVLRAEPKHVDALNLFGVVLGRLGRQVEAIASFDRALVVAPNSDESWYGRGMSLLAMNDPRQAIKSFDRVIVLKPELSQVHLLRAKLLVDLGRQDAALEAIDALIAKFPELGEAWLGRSNVLFSAKRYDEALIAAERAVALKPDFAEAWHGRGNALHELKRHDEALEAYDKALGLHPHFAGARHGRGNALNALRRYHEALNACDRALASDPGLTAAWLGRGFALIELRRHHEALHAFDRAASSMPNLVEAWLGRSSAYVELGQLDKALSACDRALAIKPDLQRTRGGRLHIKLQLSDWTNVNSEISDIIASVRANETPIAPFEFLAISSSPADQLLCAKKELAEHRSLSAAWRGQIYAHDRIRIGYFSADLRNHAVGHLAVGLLEAHDKSRFETIALSFGPDDGSDLRRRITSATEHFIDVENVSDADLTALICRREIDILVDLTGFTTHSRSNVLARRVAPVQVNFLGYSGTMGADCVDYIVADRTVIPEDHFRFYTEQVVWLPDTYQPNAYRADGDKRRIPERLPTRAECNLPEAGFVFCSFNNTYKITPAMFDLWMRLLRAIPDSVLWLSKPNATAEANLGKEAARRGVSPERIIFAPRLPEMSDHLARQRHANLFLDTLPYNAHTTASDALWAGLPVVTCLGETFAGRVAASLSKAVGLPELITTSLQDYEALALRLARDPALLGGIKDKLLRNRDTYPLFDTPRFTRHLEAAYTTMWQRYQRGEPPHAFAVDSIPSSMAAI